ncbi:unnamed protein product [Pleuronectes platessa]|uniref:Uncharacterized protein n=1 Tax=Pleuronectes platessa TaxID=8262 RepID=A0A9N7V8U1_PLEPL|nr:unnamed protein product [Pleuronectes platessa]
MNLSFFFFFYVPEPDRFLFPPPSGEAEAFKSTCPTQPSLITSFSPQGLLTCGNQSCSNMIRQTRNTDQELQAPSPPPGHPESSGPGGLRWDETWRGNRRLQLNVRVIDQNVVFTLRSVKWERWVNIPLEVSCSATCGAKLGRLPLGRAAKHNKPAAEKHRKLNKLRRHNNIFTRQQTTNQLPPHTAALHMILKSMVTVFHQDHVQDTFLFENGVFKTTSILTNTPDKLPV